MAGDGGLEGERRKEGWMLNMPRHSMGLPYNADQLTPWHTTPSRTTRQSVLAVDRSCLETMAVLGSERTHEPPVGRW